MKIALFTDLHYGTRNDSPVFYEYQKKTNTLFFDTLRNRGITDIICLGDLYDRKKYVNYVTANRARVDFLNIVENEFKMAIIAGNHDIFHKNHSEINALQELVHGRFKNIECVFTPQSKFYDNTEILLLPWINSANYDLTMNTIADTKAQICFGHLELLGFEMDKGVINHDGQDSAIFSKFELVASGHFHHKSTKGNINYLGAAYEFSWADWNDPRGFTIFDTETKELEFIKSPYTMFNMIAYDDENNLNELQHEIKSGDFSKYVDTYVRIVAVKKTNPYLFDQFLDKLYKAGPQDITVVEDASMFVEEGDAEAVNQGEDTMTILNKYIDGLKMDTDAPRVKEMIKQIYLEAISIKETHDT